MKELIQRVVEAHGKDRPELSKLQETFNELSEELLQHMNKEELILFPEIKKLLNEIPISTSFPFLPMNIQAPMAMMEDEHTHAGDLIKSIRSMTRNYNPPASACPTYKITYKRLEEFDQDLMQHIHLENNVLFNKVRSKLTAPVL